MQRTFSWHLRLADVSHSAPRRIPVDAASARRLVEAFDEAAGVVSWLFDASSGGPAAAASTAEHALDLAVLYLRRVHYVCYYSATAAQSPHDLVRLAGDLVLRSPYILAPGERPMEDKGKEKDAQERVEDAVMATATATEVQAEMAVETETGTETEAQAQRQAHTHTQAEPQTDRKGERNGHTSSPPELEAFDAAVADLLERCTFRCDGFSEDQYAGWCALLTAQGAREARGKG